MDVEKGTTANTIQNPRLPGLAAGTRLFERFTLQKLLGQGEVGMVWLAHDDSLDRLVALKLFSRTAPSHPLAAGEVVRETGPGLLLVHPNVARIFEFFEDTKIAAVVREYVDGPTLSELRGAKRANCFAVSEIAPWVSSLCDALAYAHDSMDVVHGDLKPSNLMVTGRKELKITDFGFAALCGPMGQPGSGNLDYLSPQRLRGEAPSPADDIYAVGAILYELLSSRPPFFELLPLRDGAAPLVAQRRNELGIVGEAVPRHWEETIAACLAVDPAARPPSPVELARRLRLGATIRLTVTQQESKMRGLMQALFQARVVGAAAGVAALVAAAVIVHHSSRTASTVSQIASTPTAQGFAMELAHPDAVATPIIAPLAVIAPTGTGAIQVPESTVPHGTANITSNPDGAEIFLGTRSLGHTPLTVDLPLGSLEITARHPEWSERNQTVAIEKDAVTTVAFDLRSTTHASRRKAKPPESALDKLKRSVKKALSGKKG